MKTKRELVEVLQEREILFHSRESNYTGLVCTTQQLELLRRQKQELLAKLEQERSIVESVARDCFQLDELLSLANSADADYLLPDILDRIEAIQHQLLTVDLEAMERQEQRMEYQRQFLATEAKLAQIAAEVRKYFP